MLACKGLNLSANNAHLYHWGLYRPSHVLCTASAKITLCWTALTIQTTVYTCIARVVFTTSVTIPKIDGATHPSTILKCHTEMVVTTTIINADCHDTNSGMFAVAVPAHIQQWCFSRRGPSHRGISNLWPDSQILPLCSYTHERAVLSPLGSLPHALSELQPAYSLARCTHY